MKILFYGNHLKHFYLAKWLRNRGHECSLYLTRKDLPGTLPEWDDPTLKNNYPDWIIEDYDTEPLLLKKIRRKLSNSAIIPLFFLRALNYNDIFPSRRAKQLAAKHHVVFTSGRNNIIQALHLNKRLIFRSIGSDMSKLPFQSSNYYQEFLSYNFRKNINRVSCLLAYQEDTLWAAHFLSLNNKIRYFSIPTDINDLHDNMDHDLLEWLNKKYVNYDLVFFLPARKVMDKNDPAYKGPEKFLEALKRFSTTKPNIKVIAIMGGKDTEKFRCKIRDMNLQKYFDYVEGYVPLRKLSAYMSMQKTIVFNDFGFRKNHLTGISREALSLGAILVDAANTGHKNFLKLYGIANCPLCSAVNEHSLFTHMEHLTSLTPPQINELRKNALNWAVKYLHWENKIQELEELLNKYIQPEIY